LEIALSPDDVAVAGKYPVTVTNPSPGGGPSSAVNFNIVTGTPTGSFDVAVGASIGALAHSSNLTLVVQ
jgi:hypothetical protein